MCCCPKCAFSSKRFFFLVDDLEEAIEFTFPECIAANDRVKITTVPKLHFYGTEFWSLISCSERTDSFPIPDPNHMFVMIGRMAAINQILVSLTVGAQKLKQVRSIAVLLPSNEDEKA